MKIDNIMDELLRRPIYEKNIDVKDEKNIYKMASLEELYKKNIYEMTRSKLSDLLDAKFEHFEKKLEGLLREPKFNNKAEIYDSTPRASTTRVRHLRDRAAHRLARRKI